MGRASRDGDFSRLLATARYDARSRAFHSHSRFCRKSNGEGNVSLLTVVSIWKILTPSAFSSWPIRQFDECSSERCWSMNEVLRCMVRTLWWWRRLRYDASPVATLLWPPSMATRLRLT